MTQHAAAGLERVASLLNGTEPSIDAQAVARRDLKARYRELFDGVSAILFRIDPVGINFDDNTDEYEPEAGTIIPRLKSAASAQDVRRIVEEEFVRWFGEPLLGPSERHAAAAEEIWELWMRMPPQRP